MRFAGRSSDTTLISPGRCGRFRSGRRLAGAVAQNFSVGFSGDWNAGEALIAGADAWYSVLGGLFPAPAVAMDRAVRRSDIEGVRQLDEALASLWDLFKIHSSLRVIYAAAKALCLCSHGPPFPILPLEASVQTEVAAVVGQLQALLEGA